MTQNREMAKVANEATMGFGRLTDALPPSKMVGIGENMEYRARAVLSYIVDRLDPAEDSRLKAVIEIDPSTCPNCSTPVSSPRSPYCSEQCREVAGFVRQFRANLADGAIFQEDRQVALGQVLWFLLGGGRPLRQSLAPPRSLQAVLKREAGRCQACGGTATTIDHIATGCNRPINLRAVCEACCLDRPFGDPLVTGSVEFGRLLEELAARIGSLIALRCCDDPNAWNWREYLKARTEPPEVLGISRS
jgi:hypothetical protein